MADRYFPNEMPESPEELDSAAASSLSSLLRLPYPNAAERFLQAALNLKQKVVKETRRCRDWTLYTGSLGTAFLLLKSYLVTKDAADLSLCAEIVGSCEASSRGSSQVTFICGRAGVCALGAVVAKYIGDKEMLNYYVNSFKEGPKIFEVDMENANAAIACLYDL